MFSATVLGVEPYDVFMLVLVCGIGVVVAMVSCLAAKDALDFRVGTLLVSLSPIDGFGGTEHRRLVASYEGDAS
jgi:hypothetical protein